MWHKKIEFGVLSYSYRIKIVREEDPLHFRNASEEGRLLLSLETDIHWPPPPTSDEDKAYIRGQFKLQYTGWTMMNPEKKIKEMSESKKK